MTRPSIRDRRKLASNLRAAPAWLSPRRVDGILSLLGALDDRDVPVFTFAPIAAPTAEPAPVKPDCVSKPRKRAAPRPAPTIETETEIVDAPVAAVAEPVVAARRDHVGDDHRDGDAVALTPLASAQVIVGPRPGVQRWKAALEALVAAPAKPIPEVRHTPIRAVVHGTPEGKVAIVSWVEQKIARERAAIAFLQGKGFSVSRMGESSLIARYWVSGYRGDFSGNQVVELATARGFAS